MTKPLYCLIQASRYWYRQFDSFILRLGFRSSEDYHSAYFWGFSNGGFIILLYVDDVLVVGTSKEDIVMLNA